MRKRLRELEEQVSNASTATQQPRLGMVSNQLVNLENSLDKAIGSVDNKSPPRRTKALHRSLRDRAFSDELRFPRTEELYPTLSPARPKDRSELLYEPPDAVASSETVSLFDPSSCWDLPTPNETVAGQPLNTPWPSLQGDQDAGDYCTEHHYLQSGPTDQ